PMPAGATHPSSRPSATAPVWAPGAGRPTRCPAQKERGRPAGEGLGGPEAAIGRAVRGLEGPGPGCPGGFSAVAVELAAILVGQAGDLDAGPLGPVVRVGGEHRLVVRDDDVRRVAGG